MRVNATFCSKPCSNLFKIKIIIVIICAVFPIRLILADVLMNSSSSINTGTARPTPKKKAKAETPISYRFMILYRFILALFGGYILAAVSAIAIAELFIEQRANAAMSATLIAFCVQCAAFIWVFMVQKTLKATLGIVLPCLGLWLLLKLLGN